MRRQPKPAPAAPAASSSAPPATPAQAPSQTPAAPAAPAQVPAAAPAAPSTPTPTRTAPTAETAGAHDPNGVTLGTERAEAIANMEAMGFERSQIDAAMRAAFYNPERAVEYLLTVIHLRLPEALYISDTCC